MSLAGSSSRKLPARTSSTSCDSWEKHSERVREWKTVICRDGENLCPLASAGWANRKTPFLTLANVASIEVSCRSSLPRAAADYLLGNVYEKEGQLHGSD